MKFHDNFYTGDLSPKEVKSIVKKIKNKKRTYIDKFYCIILPLFDDGVLEIYEHNQLLLPYIIDKDIVIVGIAKQYDEAIEYVAQIVDDIYKQTGDVNIYKYFN